VALRGDLVHNRRLQRYRLIMCLIVALYIAGTMQFVFLGDLNHDEGYYLCAARQVYQGKMPYADFALFQAPLLPYVYGIPQVLFGSSILVGRLTSFALGLITILLSSALARRLAGDMASVIASALLCATSTFLWVFSTTRTEPLTVFFVVLSLHGLLRPSGSRAGLLTVSAMIWATAARISFLPATLFVLCVAMYSNRRSKAMCAAIIFLATLQFLILFGIPLAAGRGNMVFDVLRAQLWRHRQFDPGVHITLWQQLSAGLISVLDHLTRLYVGATLASVTLVVFVLLTSKFKTIRQAKPHYLIAVMLATALYVPQLTVIDIGEVYLMPSAVIITIVLSCCLSDFHQELHPSPGAALLSAMAVSMIITQAISGVRDARRRIHPTIQPIAQLRDAARYVQAAVEPDEQIVTFSTYIAIEADREVAPGLETSWFSLFPAFSDERARELKVVNVALFNEALRDNRTTCVLLTDFDMKLLAQAQEREIPPGRPLAETDLFALLDDLRGNYTLAKIVPSFGQWHDHLYILLR